MGLPVKFFCGTNANDIFYRTVNTGRFHKRDLVRTMSEAINIQVPYNFERILYFLFDRDSPKLKAWMEQGVEREGKADVPPAQLSRLRDMIQCARVEDKDMLDVIRSSWDQHRYLVDPHTAVILAAHRQLVGLPGQSSPPCVLLSTAHACKFEEALRESLGDKFWDTEMPSFMPPSAAALYTLPERPAPAFRQGEDWTQRLQELVEASYSEQNAKL